jgi:HAD superfamily hydrolase (TIGR01509 family)
MKEFSIAAAVFDMDGLMLDTERIALAVLAEAASALRYPWREEIGLAMVGLNSRDSDAIVAAELGPDYPLAPLRATFGERYLRRLETEQVPTKPGLVELLDALKAANVPCAVATSTRHERARLKLARAGVLDRFSVIVGGDQVRQGKPEPDIYLATALALDVDPGRCIAFEDSGPGVRAALAAGMRVVMVPDVIAPTAEIVALGHSICATLTEALALLRSEGLLDSREGLPIEGYA